MLSDAQLMELVQAGQTGLFDELIIRHRPGLLRFAGSSLADRDAAEDAVQEALLAAFAARRTYNPRFAFSTWVYTILLNVCRRHRRRRQPMGDSGGDLAHWPAGGESPLDQLLRSETRELLAELLAELPDVEADALRLRFFAGLPFDEIALAMNSSVTGAKVRVRRGLERLAARAARIHTTAGDCHDHSLSPHARRSTP
ncbi:MAG: sigma-70 family RNA polymerase sigma factor [Planctomycetaceae bacterium]|nr:sigma-70 family RNA polymerase sigma factor [Planctomycetaceae bacterium]